MHRTFAALAAALVASLALAPSLAAAGPFHPRAPQAELDLDIDLELDAARPLQSNQSFVDYALATIAASQRASWEQGVIAQAVLEWQYPEWSTFEAPAGPASFVPASAARGRSSTPRDTILAAMRSVVAQDSVGRLGARVTGDEDTAEGSSLDSVSNLESVLVAALASGQISASGTRLAPANGNFAKAAQSAYNFVAQDVRRGRGGIISQRMDRLQYWSDSLYMGPPAIAAYGLYTQNADALQLAYDQARLYLSTLTYPAGTGSKAGLVGHIRNDDGSWQDNSAWLTGQGWAALGNLRVVAALAQSAPTLSAQTQRNVADLLRQTTALLRATHARFDADARLWHNYVDDPDTFTDISGSLAVAAATYRLAALAPAAILPASDRDAWLRNAEAVHARVVPHLQTDGQFGDGLQCVDALAFSAPGFTSVEALSFGVLLEAARREYARVSGAGGARAQTTALVRTLQGLSL